MINFDSLQLFYSSKYSFVGIEKKEGILCFCLPKGFSKNIDEFSGFSKKRDLFFLFYKIFDTFKKICADKGYLDKVDEFGKKDRDGVIKSSRGSEIEDDGDDSENIFYSKLDIIGSLLDVYDEPKILSLAYRLGRSDKFDVSQIHKYLHQALYLPNNAAYVDQMLLPKKVLQFESTDIVSMYCYLFCEVKLQLKENVSTEITSLSERFREKYLRSGDSLFDEQSYEQVLDILKDALETIDHNTPIKDADYWQYYEAIELFLYGDLNKEEDGEIWGVSNFHSVWESMCLTYIAKNNKPSYILNLDAKYISHQVINHLNAHTKELDLSKVFNINSRQLFPDIVLYNPERQPIRVNGLPKSYIVSADLSWDDDGYFTAIKSANLPVKKFKFTMPRIVYVDQEIPFLIRHTIAELRHIYLAPTNDVNTVIIDAPLPRNFYSFWEIPANIDYNLIHRMYYFNHLFSLALEQNIIDANKFYDDIILPLGEDNVFTNSLLRSYKNNIERIKDTFTDFIQRLHDKYEKYLIKLMFRDFSRIRQREQENIFEIIDIKYLDSNYLTDASKIEKIKENNVRKQFVYEYLLQNNVQKANKRFANLSIQSSFWLPSYRPDDPNLIEDGETFMDGYIQLKNINFAVLAENYIA